MRCGHSIHKQCYKEHASTSYKCPICNKSLFNMDPYFRNLDASIQYQPMPEEYCNLRAAILCNDCSARSTVPMHWLGLKCDICHSYNTVELQSLGQEEGSDPPNRLRLDRLAEVIHVLGQQSEATFERIHRINAADYLADGVRGVAEDDLVVQNSYAAGEAMSRTPSYLRDDDDSDYDILRFWGSHDNAEQSDEDEGEDEDEDDEEVEEEDEPEVEDGLFLLGHR